MAWSALFGAGTLTYGATEIPVSNISLDDNSEVIELTANKEFSLAAANGKRSIKGSFTVQGYESVLLSSIENAVMAPLASATSLTWVLPAGVSSVTFTLVNVLLTSKKVSSGNDKFMSMEIGYIALPESGGDTVMTVA